MFAMASIATADLENVYRYIDRPELYPDPMETLSPPLNAEVGAQLVEAVGTAEFGQLLLKTARSLCRVEELFGYIVLDGEEPNTIVSSSVLDGYEARVTHYVQRYYQHDPAVHEIRKIAMGDSFVQRIGLGTIIPYDYREQCFAQPGFDEKLSFGWRGAGYVLVLSFYRRDAKDEEALFKLSSLANLTLPIMVRHHAPVHRDNVIDVLERRLVRSFVKLTRREVQICARTLAGRTAHGIAAEFALSPGTILTYRQRAYQKYGFRKANEFLPSLLN